MPASLSRTTALLMTLMPLVVIAPVISTTKFAILAVFAEVIAPNTAVDVVLNSTVLALKKPNSVSVIVAPPPEAWPMAKLLPFELRVIV